MTKILFGSLKSILYVLNVIKMEDKEILYTILLLQYMILINRHRCLLKYKRRVYKRRRWWVHLINNMRNHQGDFAHLFQELRYDADIFFKYTRMNKDTFNLLLCKVQLYLQKNNW